MNANIFCNKCHRIPSQCVCSHAQKELSDEEIRSIWNEGIVGWYATQEESVLKFAREILKKASEK